MRPAIDARVRALLGTTLLVAACYGCPSDPDLSSEDFVSRNNHGLDALEDMYAQECNDKCTNAGGTCLGVLPADALYPTSARCQVTDADGNSVETTETLDYRDEDVDRVVDEACLDLCKGTLAYEAFDEVGYAEDSITVAGCLLSGTLDDFAVTCDISPDYTDCVE